MKAFFFSYSLRAKPLIVNQQIQVRFLVGELPNRGDKVQVHGTGKYGIRVTWKTRNRQNELWSETKAEREADYDMHKNKPEVKSVTRIER